jgi:hypothetical protein
LEAFQSAGIESGPLQFNFQETRIMADKKPQVTPIKPEKKPGRWSRFVQAVGEAIGQAKFGG